MLIPTPSAKSSTFAAQMKKESKQLSHSSAPMEPSSTRTTLSVIGGSTLNALKLKAFTR
jgi:hypothetical protein